MTEKIENNSSKNNELKAMSDSKEFVHQKKGKNYFLLSSEEYNKVLEALSQKYPKLFIKDRVLIFKKGIHKDIFEGEVLNATLHHYFKNLKKIDAVILGCTHFPLIQKQISHYLDDCFTIHSGDAIVKYIQDNYNYDKNFEKTNVTLFASENPQNLKISAKKWLGSLIP